MPNIETIAVILGILIVIVRLPVVIWPKKLISLWKHKLSKESFAKTWGAIALILGLILINYIWNEISLLQLLVGGISIFMIIIGGMIFFLPKLPATILGFLERKLPLVRILAFIAVLFGLFLIDLVL